MIYKLRQLFWESTLRCNMQCLHCGSDCRTTSETPDMPLEHFLPVLDEVKRHQPDTKTVVFTLGGEPLVRKGVVGLVESITHTPGIENVSMTTNGVLLAQHGFAAAGHDHLGHGLTAGGKFGYFGPKNGWDLVARDIRRLRELEGEKHPSLPYVILGHSMGSFLTRTYLIRWPGTVDAAVLSGTGQESAAAVASGKSLAGTLCKLRGPDHVSKRLNDLPFGSYNRAFKPNRTTSDWLSRDEAAVDAYLADPLCGFLITAAMFRDMMGGLQYIASEEGLANMDPRTPVYLFSGGQGAADQPHLKQRGGEDRDAYPGGQLPLEHGQKAAAGGDGGGAGPLQRLGAGQEGLQQGGVAVNNHALGVGPLHQQLFYGEWEGVRIAHVARNTGEFGVQHQNT